MPIASWNIESIGMSVEKVFNKLSPFLLIHNILYFLGVLIVSDMNIFRKE